MSFAAANGAWATPLATLRSYTYHPRGAPVRAIAMIKALFLLPSQARSLKINIENDAQRASSCNGNEAISWCRQTPNWPSVIALITTIILEDKAARSSLYNNNYRLLDLILKPSAPQLSYSRLYLILFGIKQFSIDLDKLLGV